jgi:hypothetical protein
MSFFFQRKYKKMSFFISLGIIVFGLSLLFISGHKTSLRSLIIGNPHTAAPIAVIREKPSMAPAAPETTRTQTYMLRRTLPHPPPTPERPAPKSLQPEPQKPAQPTSSDRITAIIGWISSILGSINILFLFFDKRKDRLLKERELQLKEKELEIRSKNNA